MGFEYINKEGTVYYLCFKLNSRGKKIYFLSQMRKGEPVDDLPADYKIHENEMGTVSVRKKKSGKGKNKLIRQQAKQSKGGKCPVCGSEITHTPLKRHIKKAHPHFRQTTPVWKTINRPVTHRQVSRSGPPMKGGKIFRPGKGAKPEPFECGWCYQLIWRVLQSNGYYRYYDDKEMKHKHMCMRPVHWRPDRS